jgi:GT2 family glycosyltransferase
MITSITTANQWGLRNGRDTKVVIWTLEHHVVTIEIVNESQRSVPAPHAGQSPDVTVIIVNWNLKEHLEECLQSLRSYGVSLAIETIVVDNASTDGSAEMVETRFSEVLLIENSDNVGFSRANNQAMEVASGRYIFLLNNDTLLFEGSLQILIDYMDDNPGVGLCGPRVVNEDGSMQIRSKGRYPSIATALGHFFLPSSRQHRGQQPLGFYEHQDINKARSMDWVSGCALLVRREAIEAVGMLDADVFMYCEDVDWCYRMNRAGWQVSYVPSSVVLHYGGKSMKKQKGKAVGAHKDGLIAFYGKYHSAGTTAVFRTILWTGYAVQAAGWLAGGLAGREGGIDKIRRLLPRRRGTS